MTNTKLAKAEADYIKAADRFQNAYEGTWEYDVASAAETKAWTRLMELRFVPGARVQAYRDGRPADKGTVVKLGEDFYVTVKLDRDPDTTRIFANQLTVV